jgi:hypothetical protein
MVFGGGGGVTEWPSAETSLDVSHIYLLSPNHKGRFFPLSFWQFSKNIKTTDEKNTTRSFSYLAILLGLMIILFLKKSNISGASVADADQESCFWAAWIRIRILLC